MGYVHQIEKLLLTDLSATTVPHVGLAHPSPLEEQNFGQLGTLLTITGPDNLRHELAITITETLKDRYYHSTELNAEAAFESALTEVNRKLHTLLAEGVTGWLPTFSGVAFAIRGDQLILSLVGRAVVQLFRGSRIQDITGTPGAERAVNPLKIFASVIVGKLLPGDAVLVASPTLLDYYSLDKLKRLITTEVPGETLATIESQLAGETHRHSFGALLISFREAPVGAQAPIPSLPSLPTQPQTSMQRLIAQEERTSAFLTPSFRTAATGAVRRILTATSDGVRRYIFQKPPRRRVPRPASALGEEMIPPPQLHRRPRGTGAVDRFLAALGNGITSLRRIFGKAVASVRRAERPDPVMVRDHLVNLPRRTERRTSRFLHRIASWPRNQQILAGIAVVLLVVFAQSVVMLGSSKSNRVSTAQQQSLYASARQKVDAAVAALTYGNELGAAQQLAAAQADLAKLPKKPKVATSDLTKLRADLATALDRTQHRRRVDNPVTVADLGAAATATPRFLLDLGTSFLIGEIGGGRYATVNPSSGAVQTLDPGAPDVGTGNHAAPEGTTGAIAYTDRNELLRYTTAKGGSFAPITLTLPTGVDVKDLAIFQTRLYLLDAPNNRILRLTRAGTTYGSPTNWISDPAVDVRSGVSLAVDGSVYVLRPDGSITLLFQGKAGSLTLTPVSPAPMGPTKIWTSADAKHLYVLDPPSHRLIVYDKQGALTEQLILPDSVPLTDFSVNEKTKQALLLSGTKILRVELAI